MEKMTEDNREVLTSEMRTTERPCGTDEGGQQRDLSDDDFRG